MRGVLETTYCLRSFVCGILQRCMRTDACVCVCAPYGVADDPIERRLIRESDGVHVWVSCRRGSSVVRRGLPSVGAPAWAMAAGLARACAGRLYRYVLHDVTDPFIGLTRTMINVLRHDICLPHTHHRSLTVTAVHTTYLLCPRTAHLFIRSD